AKRSSRSWEDFEPIWDRAQGRQFAARTRNLVFACYATDSVFGMSLPRLSIIRFRRIVCKNSIFSSGGMTKRKQMLEPMGFRTIQNGTSRGYQSICFEDLWCGPSVGW